VIVLVTCGHIERTAKLERSTKETLINVEVNIDGTGKTHVKTGLSFIDHLITAISTHSLVDVSLIAKSHDSLLHHLVEDISITLSQSISNALGDRSQIMRLGSALVPMDDSLAYASLDLIKRQYSNIQLKLTRDNLEGIPREDLEHFVNSFAQNLNACTHIIVEYGNNDHHKIECAVKAFAVAFRTASCIDKKRKWKGIPSSKGKM
jgi:imidazoleglycerol-phosphate dehydratase